MVYIPLSSTNDVEREHYLREEIAELAKREDLLKKAEQQLKVWDERLADKEAELAAREVALNAWDSGEEEEEMSGGNNRLVGSKSVAAVMKGGGIPVARKTLARTSAQHYNRKVLEATRGVVKPQQKKGKPTISPVDVSPSARVTLAILSDNSKKQPRLQPKGSWQFWMDENRTRLMAKARDLGLTGSVIFKLGSDEWRQVADKSKWRAMAEEDKERVKRMKEMAGITSSRAGSASKQRSPSVQADHEQMEGLSEASTMLAAEEDEQEEEECGDEDATGVEMGELQIDED